MVLATPVHRGSMTGVLKNLLDALLDGLVLLAERLGDARDVGPAPLDARRG